MRIRSIKPEFWRSPDISCLSIEDRLLFIGLWSYVDDNGVGEDRVAMIAADLFADDLSRDPSETFARVSRGLASLFAAGRITRYTVENRDYLEISNWTKHQRIDRPGKERMPRSDHESAHPRESVANDRETPLTGSGIRDQGTEDQVSIAQPSGPSEFDTFWSVFPRKVGKQKARTKYAAAVKRAGSEQIVIDGARRLAADPNLPEHRFIPHPTTWLERDGWDDEPLPSSARPGSRENTLDAWGTPAGTTPGLDVIDGEVVEFRRALP